MKFPAKTTIKTIFIAITKSTNSSTLFKLSSQSCV